MNKNSHDDNFPEIEFAEALPRVVLAHDLAEFMRQAWEVLHPGRKLTWSWHYDLLCEYLVLVKRGIVRRMIINVPPRTLKSSLVTIIFPVWGWLTDPCRSFMTVSYNSDLSTEHSVQRRRLLQSDWFREVCRNSVQLAGDLNRADQFSNTKGGADDRD